MNKMRFFLLSSLLLGVTLLYRPTDPMIAMPAAPTTATAWELLTPPEPVRLWRSPHYARDHALYLASARELRRSSDDGDSWSTLYTLPEQFSGQLTGFAADPTLGATTLFLTYTDAAATPGAVLRSLDGGATWEWVYSYAFGPLYDIVVAQDVESCAVYAPTWGGVLRSYDCGATWDILTNGLEESHDLFRLAISPTFLVDRTLYLTGYGPLYRTTDGGDSWHTVAIPWADIPRQVLFSPDYVADQTLWVSYFWVEGSGEDELPPNGIVRSTDSGATWEKLNTGLPVDYPDGYIMGLGISPDYPVDPALYLMEREVTYTSTHWRLYRSPHSGDGWWEQEPLPDDAATPTGLVMARRDALFVPTQRGLWRLRAACWEHLRNGSAETNTGWEFPDTPTQAGYSEAHAYSGRRSLRVGITAPPNRYAYSSARQWMSIPTNAVSATLSFWLRPVTTETQLAPSHAVLSTSTPAAGDAQYVLLLTPEGDLLETLVWMKRAAEWEPYTFDLSHYAGETVRLHFGVYNDGAGGMTGLYVDEVSLRACEPASPPPLPPLPAPASAEEDFLLSDAPSAQYRPALAYNGLDDETLLVWEDYRHHYPTSIYAQRINSSGQLLGAAQPISIGSNPRVAYLGNAGIYLVVWEDYRHIEQTPDIYGRLVNRQGQPVGEDFPIYSGPGYQGGARIVASASEDSFLVVWASSIDFISSVWGQRIDALGQRAGNPIAISDGSGWAGHPALAYSADVASYVVVWTDGRDGPHNSNIYGQRIAAQDGALIGDNFPICTRTLNQVWPAVAATPEGELFVAWNDWRWGSPMLYARRLAADGTPLGNDFAIAAGAHNEQLIAITTWNAGARREFLMVWQAQSGAGDLVAQRFAQSGGRLGEAFCISSAQRTQGNPAVAAQDNATPPTYLIIWEDFRAGGPGGIYGQRITPEGERLGLPTGLTPLPYLQKHPALAYSSSSDNTLAVWANVHGGGGNQSTHILGYLFRNNRELATWPITLTGQLLTSTTQVAVDWHYGNDEFLVVWSAAGNIIGQRVTGTGSLVGDNLTLAALEGVQQGGNVAAGINGYLIVFEHTHPISQTTDIYAQLLTATGEPLAPAVNISRLLGAGQQARNAHLTYNALHNSYYVVWEEEDPTSPGITRWNIAGQMVAGEDGSPLGPRRTLAAAPGIQQNHPRIAWAGTEDAPFYLLLWSTFDMHLGQAEIIAQRLAQDGAPEGVAYALTATQLEQELRPALSYDPFTRRFLAMWDVTTQGMPYADAVQGVQLDASGQPEGALIVLAQDLRSGRQTPVVTARRGRGEWLIAWEDGRADQGVEHINIYARRVNAQWRAYLPLILRE